MPERNRRESLPVNFPFSNASFTQLSKDIQNKLSENKNISNFRNLNPYRKPDQKKFAHSSDELDHRSEPRSYQINKSCSSCILSYRGNSYLNENDRNPPQVSGHWRRQGQYNPFMKPRHNTYPPYPPTIENHLQNPILLQRKPSEVYPNCVRTSVSYSEIDNYFEPRAEENIYSYVGEDVISPAEAIRNEAVEDVVYEEPENIYEEIREKEVRDLNLSMNRKSLVEEVFDEYERIRSYSLDLNRSNSIITLDFTSLNRCSSENSDLTIISDTDTLRADDWYDVVEKRGFPDKDSVGSRGDKVRSCVFDKPPLPRMSRCESMDIKDRQVKRTKSSVSKSESMASDKSEKKENLFRNHLRASGRGLKNKLEEMRGKLEQSKRSILNKGKKDKKSITELSPPDLPHLTPPSTPPVMPVLLRGNKGCPQGYRDSQSSQSSSAQDSTEGREDPENGNDILYDSVRNTNNANEFQGCPNTKTEMKTTFSKSMLPGLSGLQGLSNLKLHTKKRSSEEDPKSLCVGNSNAEEIAWVSKRLQAHRQLSSSDSWGSQEFDCYSSNDEDASHHSGKEGHDDHHLGSLDHSVVSEDSSKLSEANSSSGSNSILGREKLKSRLLRKREQWRERRQSSNKDFRLQNARKESSEEAVATPDGGKLSRWFSLRKSVNYDTVDRKATSKPSILSSDSIAEEDQLHSSLHNSCTLSSISSHSSASSSSSASSYSSNPPYSARLPQLLEEHMSELDSCTNPNNFYTGTCGVGGLGALGANTFQRRHQPPSLPPIPPGLTSEQIKRRHIVASIVHSENNYVATLHRLVREYRKPLEESKPPILSQSKVNTLFHYVHEILQCHTMFRLALTECVRHWDRDEKIGDVFFASFSKGVVLDIYSEFINNFSKAMECAKLESRKKSIFADFLKMRQISSPDRLSFFGMMVKPVQRFPQFILFLQDLLKHTPKGHADRMSLQLALTQLESLAETLNEQKRESEQHQAFKQTLKQINSKFALRNISEGNGCLIRQDDVSKLEFGQSGLIKQTKERRLFLTSDTVICVSVVPKTNDDFNSTSERLSLKWLYPVTEIEVEEGNSSLTLSRLLAAGNTQRPNPTPSSQQLNENGDSVPNFSRCSLEESEAIVGALCSQMNDLMHDYTVVSRIAELASTLKGSYDNLLSSSLQQTLHVIQQNIQARDDRMSWLDGCCLQIKAGKDKEVMTFHVQNPSLKKDWITELRLSQLAVSSVNSPAWDCGGETTLRAPSRRPLFVTALPLFHASQHTQVVCGCQYPLQQSPKNLSLKAILGSTGKTHTSVWLCSTDGVTSQITRYVSHLGKLRECARVSLQEVCVTALLHAPPHHTSSSPLSKPTLSPPTTPSTPPTHPLVENTIWVGTLQNKLLLYSGNTCDTQTELFTIDVAAAVGCMLYHCDQVYVGLTNGELIVFRRRSEDHCWDIDNKQHIKLSDDVPITALLPVGSSLYVAVSDTVIVLDCLDHTVTKRLSVHHGGSVSLLAHSGIGLWVCEAQSSTVCLYHTESCRHLQDIDLAPSVIRILGTNQPSINVEVTSLVVSRGLLWVGTSVGVTLTLPLPRLQGVPIISGKATLSYHSHTGPVTFLMTLMTPEYTPLPSKEVKEECPVVKKMNPLRKCSTLPRGFETAASASRSCIEDTVEEEEAGEESREMMGVCGELLRHYGGGEEGGGGINENMRRSDPSLHCISSTLDRRLKLRAGRPRSLDLSSASIDSKLSAATTSTSSEEQHNTLPRQHSAGTSKSAGKDETDKVDSVRCQSEASDSFKSEVKGVLKRHSFRGNHSLERSTKGASKDKKVHRRTSSDVTYKNLSSSTGNIASLYSSPPPVETVEVKEEQPKVKRDNPSKSVYSKGTVNLNRTPTKSNPSRGDGDGKVEDLPRTVLILTGGQGYKCLREDTPTNGPNHNNTDAHILVWEMKL